MAVSASDAAGLSRRAVKVGVLDLIAKKPTRSAYSRLMNPNYASITPQAIAVWAEELGHSVHYATFTGPENLRRMFPRDLSVLFISAFTPAAYLAYGISNEARGRGVLTVLGGPHARAYADDAVKYFDYVVGFADRDLIRGILTERTRSAGAGVRVSAPRQPQNLPGVRERWKFIGHNLAKARLLRAIPVIGSLGCPYRCSFCIDAEVDFQTLPYDQLRDDLVFLGTKIRRPVVGFHDPNFGVRFDDYAGIIEEAAPPGTFRIVAESSLSLLGESRLKELQRLGFGGLTLGVESWFDYNDKARQSQRVGASKMESVAAHVDLITRYIPYVQTNFVWGLDQDAGPEPFELTKQFIDRAPAAFPSHSLFTAFGDSAALGRRLALEGRLLDIPFHFQDTSSVHNVALKNYSAVQFYGLIADLVRYSFSPGANRRRFQRSAHGLFSPARWMTFVRSMNADWRVRYYEKLGYLFATDDEFHALAAGEAKASPAFFREPVRRELGAHYEHLPGELRAYLERGTPRRP